jgi:hypothetical protein
MFDSREGGDTVPIYWSKDNLTTDKSIIILDELNQIIWLFHGSQQGLVARRTALRQAESLKGHGYTIGKSIIGRDIREIVEIDQRKIGRVPETDEHNNLLQDLLSKGFRELENYVVTFSETASLIGTSKAPKAAAAAPKVAPAPAKKPEPVKLAKPVVAIPSAEPAKPLKAPEVIAKVVETPLEEARIAIVIKAIIDQYDDIWISKKKDGSYAVEMLDGPVCTFIMKEGGTIKFLANSFSGIAANIKNDVQKKYVELSKLLK